MDRLMTSLATIRVARTAPIGIFKMLLSASGEIMCDKSQTTLDDKEAWFSPKV